MPAKNHGTSENQAAAGRRISRPKSLRSEPVPLRRATIASQAMIAKFCAQMSTMSVTGLFGWSGSTTNTPRPPRRRARRERGDDVADPPPDAPPCTGHGRGRRTRAAEAAAEAAAAWRRRRREGAAHSRARYRWARGIRDRSRRLTPGKLHSGLRSRLPLRGTRRRAVAWSDPRRGAGPRMSRRQTDLEPGVEPDAGETQPSARRTVTRPLPRRVASRRTPARGRRPTGPRPTTSRPSAGPRRRRVAGARRRCAGCRGSCSR